MLHPHDAVASPADISHCARILFGCQIPKRGLEGLHACLNMAAALNHEEAQIDQAISQLQETVRTDIAAFAHSSPSDEAGRKLQSQIQRNTALLRARLRERELLAEEQET